MTVKNLHITGNNILDSSSCFSGSGISVILVPSCSHHLSVVYIVLHSEQSMKHIYISLKHSKYYTRLVSAINESDHYV